MRILEEEYQSLESVVRERGNRAPGEKRVNQLYRTYYSHTRTYFAEKKTFKLSSNSYIRKRKGDISIKVKALELENK